MHLAGGLNEPDLFEFDKTERKSGPVLQWEIEEFKSQTTERTAELRCVEMADSIVKYMSLGLKSLGALWYPSIIKNAADQNRDKTIQLEAVTTCLVNSTAATTGRKVQLIKKKNHKD